MRFAVFVGHSSDWSAMDRSTSDKMGRQRKTSQETAAIAQKRKGVCKGRCWSG